MLEIEAIDTWRGPAQILRRVSLKVGSRESVCLVGRNGAGKTARMRFCVSCSETWSFRPDASAIQRQTWKFSATVRSVNSPASSGA